MIHQQIRKYHSTVLKEILDSSIGNLLWISHLNKNLVQAWLWCLLMISSSAPDLLCTNLASSYMAMIHIRDVLYGKYVLWLRFGTYVCDISCLKFGVLRQQLHKVEFVLSSCQNLHTLLSAEAIITHPFISCHLAQPLALCVWVLLLLPFTWNRWVLLLYVIAQHLEPWPEIWWCFGYSHNPLTLCLVHFATHIHAGFFCFFGYLYGYCLILGYVILSYIYNQQWSVYLLLFCLFSSLLNWGSFCICLRHMEGDHI